MGEFVNMIGENELYLAMWSEATQYESGVLLFPAGKKAYYKKKGAFMIVFQGVYNKKLDQKEGKFVKVVFENKNEIEISENSEGKIKLDDEFIIDTRQKKLLRKKNDKYENFSDDSTWEIATEGINIYSTRRTEAEPITFARKIGEKKYELGGCVIVEKIVDFSDKIPSFIDFMTLNCWRFDQQMASSLRNSSGGNDVNLFFDLEKLKNKTIKDFCEDLKKYCGSNLSEMQRKLILDDGTIDPAENDGNFHITFQDDNFFLINNKNFMSLGFEDRLVPFKEERKNSNTKFYNILKSAYDKKAFGQICVTTGDKKDAYKYDVMDLYRAFECTKDKSSNEKNKYIVINKVQDGEKIFVHSNAIILSGPPGTGKTKRAKEMAMELTGGDESCIRLVQLHPGYSYNDFMETIDITKKGYTDRLFKIFAQKAANDKDKKYVMIIDEINRANVSEVLGELLYGLEYREKNFTTGVSNKSFNVPNNLYIIGTMNTADKSLQTLDYAVRRRFAFEKVESKKPIPKNDNEEDLSFYEIASYKDGKKMFFLNDIFKVVKEDVTNSVARGISAEDIMPGVSYFIIEGKGDIDYNQEHLVYKIRYELIPLLREYIKDGMFTNRNKIQDGYSLIELVRSGKYEEKLLKTTNN